MPSPYDNLRFSQSQFIPQYAGAPIEEFSKLLQNREASYQKNIADFDAIELAAANANVNDADYAVKKEALDKVRGAVQGIADSGGAFEFAGSQIRAIAKDFTSNQGLKTALENQATIMQEREKFEDLHRNKKISFNAYQEGLKRLNNYKGVGKGEEGIYNKPEIYNAVNYVDVADALNKYGTGWKEEMRVTQGINPATGISGLYSETTRRYIDPAEVRAGMQERIESDADMKAYLEEEAKLTGKTYEQMIEPIIDAQVLKLGFDSRSTSIKTIPGFSGSGTTPADPNSNAAYKQNTASGGDEVLAGGAIEVKKYKETAQIQLDELNKQVNEAIAASPDKTDLRLAQSMENLHTQREVITTKLADYEKAETRIKEAVEELFGEELKHLTPAQEKEVEEYLEEGFKAYTSISIGNLSNTYNYGIDEKGVKVTKEEAWKKWKNDHSEEAYIEVSPIYAEYDRRLREIGSVDSIDIPVYMVEDPKDRKDIDDEFSRILSLPTVKDVELGEAAGATPIGLFEAAGETQGEQVTAEAYPEFSKVVYAGVGLDKDGNPVVLVNMFDGEGNVLGNKKYTNDPLITGKAINGVPEKDKSLLQVYSKIQRASKSPIKEGAFGSYVDNTGVTKTLTIEILDTNTAVKADLATGTKYKIVITDGASGMAKAKYFNNPEEINEFFLGTSLNN